MTTKRKTSPWQSRRLMPAAAAAGLSLVAVALLVPLPDFDPAKTESRTLPAPPAQTIEPPKPFVASQWSTLKDKLVALRPPPPLPPTVVDPEPDLTGDGDDIEKPPPPTMPTLGWTYAGRIEEETPFALVIMPGGKQRFLRQGQKVDDPINPRGQAILIKQVLADVLIIERNGVEQRLPLTTTATNSATAPMAMPGLMQPGGNPRINPRGPGARNQASR